MVLSLERISSLIIKDLRLKEIVVVRVHCVVVHVVQDHSHALVISDTLVVANAFLLRSTV